MVVIKVLDDEALFVIHDEQDLLYGWVTDQQDTFYCTHDGYLEEWARVVTTLSLPNKHDRPNTPLSYPSQIPHANVVATKGV